MTTNDVVAVVEDTTTTGETLADAVAVLTDLGIEVVQAVALVDRSDGAAAARLAGLGMAYVSLFTPADLGIAP